MTTGPGPSWVVRDAPPGDLALIVEFNARLASETEDKILDRATLVRRVSLDLTGLAPTIAELDAALENVGKARLIGHGGVPVYAHHEPIVSPARYQLTRSFATDLRRQPSRSAIVRRQSCSTMPTVKPSMSARC